jgi:antirestriction protein ArdC
MLRRNTMSKTDIRKQITDQIIDALEQGTLPWRCPWDRTQTLNIPVNLSTGHDYHGFNVVFLWCCQLQQRYSTGHWLTYRQAQELVAELGSIYCMYAKRSLPNRTHPIRLCAIRRAERKPLAPVATRSAQHTVRNSHQYLATMAQFHPD